MAPNVRLYAPAPNTKPLTPSAERPTPNAQRPTPNAQRPTPNAQRPTPNAQRPMQHPAPSTQHPAPSTQRPTTLQPIFQRLRVRRLCLRVLAASFERGRFAATASVYEGRAFFHRVACFGFAEQVFGDASQQSDFAVWLEASSISALPNLFFS